MSAEDKLGCGLSRDTHRAYLSMIGTWPNVFSGLATVENTEAAMRVLADECNVPVAEVEGLMELAYVDAYHLYSLEKDEDVIAGL